MYAGRSPIRWPYSGRPAPNERSPSGAKYVGVDHTPRVVQRLHVRRDDAADAAVEKAGDGAGRGVGNARDRREVVALGGDAPGLDVAPVEAAVLAVEVDELQVDGGEHLDGRGRGERHVHAADAAPLAAASLTALAFMVIESYRRGARDLHELGQEQVRDSCR